MIISLDVAVFSLFQPNVNPTFTLNFSKILKDVIHVLIRCPYLQPVYSYAQYH